MLNSGDWFYKHIKAIWNIAKTKYEYLEDFTNVIMRQSKEQMEVCFSRISFTEFALTMHKTGLLEKLIKSHKDWFENNPQPLPDLLIAVQEECKKQHVL
jgi:hypothetical protein